MPQAPQPSGIPAAQTDSHSLSDRHTHTHTQTDTHSLSGGHTQSGCSISLHLTSKCVTQKALRKQIRARSCCSINRKTADIWECVQRALCRPWRDFGLCCIFLVITHFAELASPCQGVNLWLASNLSVLKAIIFHPYESLGNKSIFMQVATEKCILCAAV